MKIIINSQLRLLCIGVMTLSVSNSVVGHGGVAFEEDLCVISINFMQAHFTVFQPETSQSDEFCEDIPDITNSVFVMEYLHDLLYEMNIDFRIVRDINNAGQYADWQDIQGIDDLEAATVYYQQPSIESGGYYRASYAFEERGTYCLLYTSPSPRDS